MIVIHVMNSDGILPRLLAPHVRGALKTFPVVVLTGARQTGKSTLVQSIEPEERRLYLTLDDIDWEDEIRVFLEERASFSADALTGLEANLRFAGPETMESKIFARLTAWQNWIFQRPNAIGDEGALRLYGTGRKPAFDTRRV